MDILGLSFWVILPWLKTFDVPGKVMSARVVEWPGLGVVFGTGSGRRNPNEVLAGDGCVWRGDCLVGLMWRKFHDSPSKNVTNNLVFDINIGTNWSRECANENVEIKHGCWYLPPALSAAVRPAEEKVRFAIRLLASNDIGAGQDATGTR